MLVNEDTLIAFYSKLESKSDLEELPIKITIDESSSEIVKAILYKEWWILSDYAANNNSNNCPAEIVKYGIDRIASTSNIFLLARYNHVLYNLTNDGSYCQTAVNNYIQILKLYVDKNKKGKGYEIHLVLNWIIQLSLRIRLELTSVEKLVITFLMSNSVITETKIWLLDSIKENYNKWKIKGLEFVPDLCLGMYLHSSDYNECKHLLEIGEFFAKRFKKELLSTVYEKMGDNEEKNIYIYDGSIEKMVIPHYNQNTYQKMMKYYQKAGNEEKLRYATAKYNKNKVGMHFIKMKEKKELPKVFIDALNKLFETIEKSEPLHILYLLSNHCNLFLPLHSTLEEKWKELEEHKPLYMKITAAVLSDINNNPVHVTHKEIWIFQCMNTCYSNSIRWIIRILSTAIKSKKLSYNIVQQILLTYSNFGEEIKIIRNDKQLNYRLFDKVDYAIKDFFVQYQKELNGKSSDWRNVINTLTIQFEGILRDSIRLYNGETSKVVGSNKENVAEMLLDDLLRTKACKELYSFEDQDLFYYAFTNKGCNIRNNVAHGFYLPHDYSTKKAILVFLCLLRLVKYNIE